MRKSVFLSVARPLRCLGLPPGLMGRCPSLYLLSVAVAVQFLTAASVAAAVYKCVGAGGATSYSDTPCAPNAESITVQSTTPTASSGLQIQTATYASPRNGRSLDVTNQMKSLCSSGSSSCTLNCGNQLAGDPDFGQRKYCSITYWCGGGQAQQQHIPEGARLTLGCSAEMARMAKQNALPPPNSRAISTVSTSTNPGASVSTNVSGKDARTGAVAPTLPMSERASPTDVTALATIVRTMGDGAENTAIDTFAALQMRLVIGPNDPNWNHSNPRYVALFNIVRQDLQHDVGPAFQTQMAQSVRELADVLGSHMPATDVRQLLGFYRSSDGQRYLAFQDRMGAIQTRGLAELTMGMAGAGMNLVPSPAPSQEVFDHRRRLMQDSWGSLLLPEVMNSVKNPASGAQQPDRESVLKAMLDVVVSNHGPEIDVIGREFAKDLSQFESFHRSSAVRSLLSAMKVDMEEAASRPRSSDPFKIALDRSIATHGPQWKAAYEAGRASAGNAGSKSAQGDLSPLVALGQVAAALEAQKPSVLKPGDADYPEEAGNPAQVIPLVVTGHDGADMRFNTEWVSDEKLCGHQVGLGGYFAYFLTFPVTMTRSADTYRGYIVVDRFKPGKCGWRFSAVGYGIANGAQNALAIPADHDESAVPQLDFWCYRVTYENKPIHDCERLVLLRWSNAMRAVSQEFLSQFSHQQQSDSHVIRITTQTKEIHLLLHDLNAIPGTLIPVGDRDAQIARAKADQAALEQTPEYKAAKCVEKENFAYVQSHKQPLPDTETYRAALTAIKQRCRAEFGLSPLPPQDGK